jgi:alkylation response protein AidB-like acyl-CoA dehydrogenase
MSVFLVEPHSPGFSLGRVQETMGGKGYGRCEIIFDDCRIPAVNLLGEEGHGFQVAMSCLEEGRISYAAGCVGMAQRLLDMSADYAKQRVQFGRPIAEFQAIQFMLAEMAKVCTRSVHGKAICVRDGREGCGLGGADSWRYGLRTGSCSREALS